MRQDVLNRLDASRKAIMELSDDELESIVGGQNGNRDTEQVKNVKYRGGTQARLSPNARVASDAGFESPEMRRAYEEERRYAYLERRRTIGDIILP